MRLIPHRILRLLATALAAGGAWLSPQAATLWALPEATPALASPGQQVFSFDSGSGAGSLALQIQGYATLDGDHFWVDVLSLQLDGSDVFAGTFNLGGGGIDRVLANPSGATVLVDSAQWRLDLNLPLVLSAGSHSLVVAYDSPLVFEGVDRAGPQGLGDEGWGINRLVVAGAAPVPEPAAAGLLLAGLALLRQRLVRRTHRVRRGS